MELWSYTKECGKIRVPHCYQEAKDLGWHAGAFYSYWSHGKYSYEEVTSWCRARLNPYLFTATGGTVWFYRERDATLCRLRWP